MLVSLSLNPSLQAVKLPDLPNVPKLSLPNVGMPALPQLPKIGLPPLPDMMPVLKPLDIDLKWMEMAGIKISKPVCTCLPPSLRGIGFFFLSLPLMKVQLFIDFMQMMSLFAGSLFLPQLNVKFPTFYVVRILCKYSVGTELVVDRMSVSEQGAL